MTKFASALSASRNLLAFYNANTAGAAVKKFADRKTAERRCALLAEELETEGFDEDAVITAILSGTRLDHTNDDVMDPSDAAEAELYAQAADADYEERHEAQFTAKPANVKQAIAAALEEQPVVDTFTNCPCCGIHLSNGYTTYDDLKDSGSNHDVDLSDMTHEYMCLGCCGYFGPELKLKAKKPSVSTGKLRPAMAESLKLDRQIKDETTGIVYKNACQVWKANLVTSSQGDRLSAALYGEAKRGNRLASLTINGRVFTLAVK